MPFFDVLGGALSEIVIDNDCGDFEIVDLIFAQNSELNALARPMIIDCLVKSAALVNLMAIGAENQVALLQARLLARAAGHHARDRSEEHTSELQSQSNIVCRLLLEK